MTTLIVIGSILAYVVLSVYCGGMNHKIQRRRCHAHGCRYSDCRHRTAIALGYPLWFVFLPSSFFFELAVGKAGMPANQSRAQKRILRERQKQALIAEEEKTLAAQKRVLELQLDIDHLTDVATDGVKQFPRKTFEKS